MSASSSIGRPSAVRPRAMSSMSRLVVLSPLSGSCTVGGTLMLYDATVRQLGVSTRKKRPVSPESLWVHSAVSLNDADARPEDSPMRASVNRHVRDPASYVRLACASAGVGAITRSPTTTAQLAILITTGWFASTGPGTCLAAVNT